MYSYDDLLKKSEELYRAPFLVKNFIATEEIDKCLEVYDELPVFEAATYRDAIRKDFLMYDNTTDSRIKNIFLSKLQDLFPKNPIIVNGGNFTEWLLPVKLHTDAYQFEYYDVDDVVDKQSVLGFSVLVPLKTDSGQGSPTTIFFKQQSFGQEINIRTVQEAKSHGVIDNITAEPFMCVYPEYAKFLSSHHGPEILHGFSVDKILSWRPGDAIVWHRAQFHCAGPFIDFNTKTHLIFHINFRAGY